MIELKEVTIEDKAKVVDYIINYRHELYPMLSGNVIPKDLENFEDVYIKSKDSAFIIATDNKSIIGTIGFIKYNDRFTQFDYSNLKTAEIVKLYVEPMYRRQGLAKKLLQKITIKAISLKYQALYLHTHPFLPGAYEFWTKNNFIKIDEDIQELMPTTHLMKIL